MYSLLFASCLPPQLNRRRGLPLGGVRVQACDWRLFCDVPSSNHTGDGSRNAGGAGAAAEQPRAAGRQPASSADPGSGADAAPALDNAASVAVVSTAAPAGGADAEGADAPLDLLAQRWDFIIGSDLIYNELGSRCLPRVLAALAAAGDGGDGGGCGCSTTTILYCHTKHRYDLLDLEFFEQLGECGLEWEEVRHMGLGCWLGCRAGGEGGDEPRATASTAAARLSAALVAVLGPPRTALSSSDQTTPTSLLPRPAPPAADR